MDKIEPIYEGYIFGTRSCRFHYEKKVLAEKAIDYLEQDMKENKEKKYCLLIDSCTVSDYLFHAISDKFEEARKIGINSEEFEIWTKRVLIVTTKLPWLQYFVDTYKNRTNEHSDLHIKCSLSLGNCLEFGALEVSETAYFYVKNFRENVSKELGVDENKSEIVSFITDNYIVRHGYENKNLKDSYCPVVRGRQHLAIKTEIAKLSDKIYIISPLTKFSFATCEELNCLNELDIEEFTSERYTNDLPNPKIMYSELEILNKEKFKEKCIFFVTKRGKNDLFEEFSRELKNELNRCYNSPGLKSAIITADFELGKCIDFDKNSDAYMNSEIKEEIPDKILRDAYNDMKQTGNRYFIWDISWKEHSRKRLKNK